MLNGYNHFAFIEKFLVCCQITVCVFSLFELLGFVPLTLTCLLGLRLLRLLGADEAKEN